MVRRSAVKSSDHAWRITGAVALMIGLVGALAAVTKSGSQSAVVGSTVKVVAGENPWGNVASQIGGVHVSVTSILNDPGTDPHLYSSDARTALAVSRADLVIVNGLGYDKFLTKLLAASPSGHRQTLSVMDVLKPTGGNPNPHLWYDIARVTDVARAIERALARDDRAHAAAYRANLVRFERSLQPVLGLLNHLRATHQGAPVAYTERVPGYVLAAAGLDVKTPGRFAQAMEDGNEPSSSDVATMSSLMTNGGVGVLLYNSQATSAATQHVRDLATRRGIPVVAVTETIPRGERTYQSWQLHQLQSLQRALDG